MNAPTWSNPDALIVSAFADARLMVDPEQQFQDPAHSPAALSMPNWNLKPLHNTSFVSA
jgi:hypothetical protein